MTDYIKAFPLTLSANGSINTIQFVDCELGDSNVTRILLTFPPGCAGLVGIRIEHGGSQVYPLTKNTWFIFDDYTLEVDPTGQGTSGQWHVAGYNTDLYPHTIQSYFFYNLADTTGNAPQPSLISL